MKSSPNDISLTALITNVNTHLSKTEESEDDEQVESDV
jgi:hypothetical protein